MHDGDSDRALSHPDRAAILDHLAGVDLASGQQIAEALGLTPASAAYHLGVLRDADLVERVGTFFDRGKAQNFYAAATS
jgi:DNA-binding transcriptional ArsR family regulator